MLNEQWLSVFLILAGLVALVIGGEWLVRGTAAVAARFRIPPLIIGLTVVAFGTSAPELGVSVQAALAGAADVAVGNVSVVRLFRSYIAPTSRALQFPSRRVLAGCWLRTPPCWRWSSIFSSASASSPFATSGSSCWCSPSGS